MPRLTKTINCVHFKKLVLLGFVIRKFLKYDDNKAIVEKTKNEIITNMLPKIMNWISVENEFVNKKVGNNAKKNKLTLGFRRFIVIPLK